MRVSEKDHARASSVFRRDDIGDLGRCSSYLSLSGRAPQADFLRHIGREFCDCQRERFLGLGLLKGGMEYL